MAGKKAKHEEPMEREPYVPKWEREEEKEKGRKAKAEREKKKNERTKPKKDTKDLTDFEREERQKRGKVSRENRDAGEAIEKAVAEKIEKKMGKIERVKVSRTVPGKDGPDIAVADHVSVVGEIKSRDLDSGSRGYTMKRKDIGEKVGGVTAHGEPEADDFIFVPYRRKGDEVKPEFDKAWVLDKTEMNNALSYRQLKKGKDSPVVITPDELAEGRTFDEWTDDLVTTAETRIKKGDKYKVTAGVKKARATILYFDKEKHEKAQKEAEVKKKREEKERKKAEKDKGK